MRRRNAQRGVEIHAAKKYRLAFFYCLLILSSFELSAAYSAAVAGLHPLRHVVGRGIVEANGAEI